MNLFKSKNPQYEYLRKKWTAKNKAVTQNLMEKHLGKVAASTLGGLMLLSTPGLNISGHELALENNPTITTAEDKNRLLAAELKDKMPTEMRNLNKAEEEKILAVLSKNLGVKALAEVDGKRLNRTYGMIGGEQHLYRYPGDSLFAHAKNAQDWAMYGSAGVAPGLGAWGYFTPSKEQFGSQDEEREKWYVVAQTFLSPGFAERAAEYRDFYKFRKMLVVNPETGQAVVGDIADAGPAEWTGKHFGGSPEVMHYLGLASGPRKGPVLFFFLDDPKDQVPLGPIKMSDDVKLAKS